VGQQQDGPSIEPGSLRQVTFGGHDTIVIPAGADIVSDPVDLSFSRFQPLSVSVYVPTDAVLPTEHYNAVATSYYSLPHTGDHTTDLAGSRLTQTTSNLVFVSGIDVVAPAGTATVVAFGDSITDGVVVGRDGILPDATVVDRNLRYPDFLQRRIHAAGLPFSVVNAGIGGNRLTADAFIPTAGIRALDRMQADVIDQASVTDAIVLFGTNDLGFPIGKSYDEMVAAFTEAINRFHAAGIAVHLGTITPSSNALVDGVLTYPLANPVRVRINNWIRSQKLSDSVIDFDAAIRNPSDPDTLNPAFSSPDNLHPNPAGYEAMSNAIDLSSLRGC